MRILCQEHMGSFGFHYINTLKLIYNIIMPQNICITRNPMERWALPGDQISARIWSVMFIRSVVYQVSRTSLLNTPPPRTTL